MGRGRKSSGDLDRELEDRPAPARWREWMGRVEAAIFAAAEVFGVPHDEALQEAIDAPRLARGTSDRRRSPRRKSLPSRGAP